MSEFIERPDRLRLYTFDELASRPPAPWLIRGVMRETSVVLLYGRRGAYKSFVGLSLAGSLATGLPWQEHEVVTPGLVIYVAAEGGGGMVQRCRALADQLGVSPSSINIRFVTEPLICQGESDDIELLVSRIQEAIDYRAEGEIDEETGYEFDAPHAKEWPSLIVIDTLARCFLGNENDPEDMGMFVQGIDRLKMEFNCSLLIVHHTGRDESHERGHTSLPGACDTIFRLDPDEDSKTLLLSCEKMKDSREPDPIDLSYREVAVSRQEVDDPNEDLTSVIIESAAASREIREKELLDILRSQGPLPWLTWMEVSGVPKTTFSRYVVGLKKSGKIIKKNGNWEISRFHPK